MADAANDVSVGTATVVVAGVTADSIAGAVADATADSFAALAAPSLLSASSGSVSCFDTEVLRGRLSFQRGGRNDVRLSGSWPNDVGTSRRATETGASMDMLVLYESGGASLDSARDSGRASERVSGLAAGTGTSVEDTRVSALGMFHVQGDSARASTALNKGDVSEAREDLRDELATSLAIVANGSDSSLERIRGFVEGRVLGSSVSILRFGAAVSGFVGITAAVDSIFGTSGIANSALVGTPDAGVSSRGTDLVTAASASEATGTGAGVGTTGGVGAAEATRGVSGKTGMVATVADAGTDPTASLGSGTAGVDCECGMAGTLFTLS